MAGLTPEMVPSVLQQFQMPNAFDQSPMQQMSAMMAMAAVAGGAGAPPFMPPVPSAPQVGDISMASLFPPGVDPAMAQVAGQAGFEAYAQWVSQYLMQAQSAAYACGTDPSGMGGGMGVPPNPFASMGAPPYAPPMPAAPVVAVSVDGMKFQYQLTEDDLHKVFSRYGSVNHIHVDEVGTTAQITFKDFHNAQAAMTDLNGKVLNGLDGTLRLVWAANQGPPSMPPYPTVPPFPNWGFPTPGAPSWPGAATAGAPAAALTAPALEPPGGFGGFAPPADLANILALGAPGVSTPPAAIDTGAAASPPAAIDPGITASPLISSADTKTGNAPAHVKGVRKYTCRFLIGIENDKEFQVVRRIIGAKGTNMKRIVRQTEAKLRLRGVGSGYFEGAGQRESSEPLQLCVSCTSYDGYRTAVRLVEELLETVYNEYRQFCRESGKPEPELHASPQLVSAGGRSGGGGGGERAPIDGDGSDSGAGEPNTAAASGAAEGESPSKRDGGRRRGRRSRAKKGDASKSGVERGDPPPKAPPLDEIERYIDARNEARRQCNFIEADRIRQSLHEKGVALMDEPGARGKGAEVTTWRYWRE